MKNKMNLIYKLLLKNKKKKALFEVEQDITFIEKHRKVALEFDEGKARREMATEQAKKVEKQDEKKIDNLSRFIAEAQAYKKEYDDLKRLRDDLKKYIETI